MKSFKDIENERKEYNNLMIVDSFNLAFRYKMSKNKSFAPDYINTIHSLARSYEAKDVIIVADHGSNYRKQILPEYKQNRKEGRTEQDEEDFKVFFAEYEKAMNILKNNYKTFKFEGVEADDIAAYLVKHHAYKYNYVWLISSDKDWDLLINEKVGRFSFVTRKEVTIDNWPEHYDVDIDQYISFKALVGDKGDNIPGVPGIGPKRACILIKEYGSAFDIYDALPIQSKYKYIQNLNEFKENIIMNYELMDLLSFCECAIGSENIEKLEETLREG